MSKINLDENGELVMRYICRYKTIEEDSERSSWASLISL